MSDIEKIIYWNSKKEIICKSCKSNIVNIANERINIDKIPDANNLHIVRVTHGNIVIMKSPLLGIYA